jgi:16S rRNA (cytidine1402-2'-O)-methyltransferase
VVATPIGNLGDISLRALEVLRSVDAVAAEDTRVTQKLLAHFGIRVKLLSLHEHNEREAARRMVMLLSEGKSVALVSDAGTPGISDPGAAAVASVREAGFRVVPLPGACAALAAISAAGVEAGRFFFLGFLPAAKGARISTLKAIARQPGLLVFYEAPHRIVECVEAMATVFGGHRRIVIAREITKLFEQWHACTLAEAAAWLGEDENRRRGEFVLLVEGFDDSGAKSDDDSQRVLEVLLDELPLKQAVKLAAEITGAKKNALYDRALKWKAEKP